MAVCVFRHLTFANAPVKVKCIKNNRAKPPKHTTGETRRADCIETVAEYQESTWAALFARVSPNIEGGESFLRGS